TVLCCAPSSVLLLSCSGHHRDLHSFPTRRSSDLIPRTSCAPFATRRSGPSTRTRRASSCPAAAGTAPRPVRGRRAEPPRVGRRRSEEHTSELQSRGHLVCRLLLEKKKITRALTDH